MYYMSKGQAIAGRYQANLITKTCEKERVVSSHDNASAHWPEIEAIHSASFNILDHPPYPPDLAPSDFHLSPKLQKYQFRGKFDDKDMAAP